MPSVGFEPTNSEGEGPQTYASARAATGTGVYNTVNFSKLIKHDIIPGSVRTLLG